MRLHKKSPEGLNLQDKYTKNIPSNLLPSDNIQFQYYGTKAYEVTAKGFITLTKFLEDHTSTENKLLFDNIAQAETEGNTQLKAQLKQNNLRAFTPCVIVGKLQDNGYTSNKPDVVGYKDYAHIEKFTGLMVLDFDHLSKYDIDAKELKELLYKSYSCLYAVWLSPSRDGIKALVKIPIVKTVKEFQEYHEGIITELADVEGLDTTTQNPTLSLFQSFDPDLLFRCDPDLWTKKAEKVSYYKYKPTQPPSKIDVTDSKRKTVLKIIRTGFNNITNTTGGHPNLRGLCISIGGYVGSGYLSESEAVQLIDYLIESHPYLQKGVKGYQKTAHKFITEGQTRPIILDHKRIS